MTSSNPLVGLGAEIPWSSIEAGHVVPGIRQLLEASKSAVAAIGASAPPTYEGVLGGLDRATEDLSRAMAVISHLEGVAMTPALREAYGTVRPEVSAFYGSIPLDAALWSKLKAFAASDEGRALSGPRRRHLDKTVDEFRRHGADLDEAGKTRLSEIDVALAQLTTRFGNHVLDDTNAFELYVDDEARLAGLPTSALDMARASAESKGKTGHRFTLQAPSVIAVLTYLDDATIRRTVWEAYNQRASHGESDNGPLIAQIVALRAEKAHLLGKRDFADLVLEDRMAKSGDQAEAFVRDLTERTEAAFLRERQELESFRRELEGPGAPPLMPWDVGYYAEKLRAARYDFDEEALRPYFAADRVVAGLFEIARRLYGVRIEERMGIKTWDDAVRVFSVFDTGASTRELGHFYADLFPRAGKRGGAWMRPLFTGAPHAGGAPHVGLICGNLTPPLAPGEAALLTHQEVETIFHEMGHLLHHLFTEVSVRSLAGTSVAWDFVELPSQIMENWTWERPALDLFARHYQTGEPLPEDLFSRLCAAKNFRSGEAQMRQLGFATLDLALHRDYDPERDGDVLAYVRGIQQEFSTATLPDDFALVASFTHLFAHPTGYAAAYYSYKWAEVLDADAFSRFPGRRRRSHEALRRLHGKGAPARASPRSHGHPHGESLTVASPGRGAATLHAGVLLSNPFRARRPE
jgi:oligopeptidase A